MFQSLFTFLHKKFKAMITQNNLSFNMILMALGVAIPILSAHAQGVYPTRPIHLIVPFAPGGTTDIIARQFGQELSILLNQPVLVENKTGAGTMVGTKYVASASADGYTLLLGSPSVWMNPILYSKAPYKLDDLAPISTLVRAPFVLDISPQLQINTLKDFVNYAKANPGKLSYGQLGVGGPSHLVAKLFEQVVGISAVDVPYRGTAPTMNDLIGGQIQFYFDGIGTSLPMYRSNKIRVMAVTSEERSPAAPEIPTFKELGYPALVADTIWGLFAPSGTPSAIIDILAVAVNRAAMVEALRNNMLKQGNVPISSSPEEFSKIIQNDLSIWSKIVQSLNIKLD